MSFWQSDDKIPILQTKVKIPAENGLNFTQGQVIHMTIPSQGVEFFQPKESYLEFTVNIGDQPSNGKTRLCLDAELGGHVLIRDISIYQNGPGGQLIEQIQNYNTLTAIKYDYESDETLRAKRALTEGCSQYSSNCRSTRQCIKSDLNNVGHNQYWQPYTYGGQQAQGTEKRFTDAYNTSIAGAQTLNVPGQQKVKCQLQLNTGIFSSSKVYPNLLTDGLRIEIQLEDGARCLRTLDTVNPLRQARNTCIIHGVEGKDAAAFLTVPTVGTLAGGFNELFIKRDNNMTDLANFPLVVGEKIALVNNTVSFKDAAAATYMVAELVGVTTVHNTPSIAKIEFVPGNAAGATTAGGFWGLIKITLDQNYTLTSATLDTTAGGWSVVSQSVSTLLTPLGAGASAGGWLSGVNYKVEDVNFVLQKLTMPGQYVQSMMSMMKSGGTINYDFLTATNYKYSQLKSDVVANIRLPLSQSRCRGILSVPSDASVYPANKQISGYGDLQADGVLDANGLITATAHNSDNFTYNELLAKSKSGSVDTPIGVGYQGTNSVRSGLVGIWDHATRYQWYYNGQLNPSRPVSLTKLGGKKSIEQQAMIELEKGLSVCGIRPLSFRKYQTNAIIARALSLQSGTYNAVGKDFNLQIEYGSTTPPEKNKLWHNFVHHIRRLEIKGNAVSIIV